MTNYTDAVNAMMVPKGFILKGTGGNCFAWSKLSKDGKREVLICVSDSIGYGDPNDDEWVVGSYDNQTGDEDDGGCVEFRTLAECIAHAETLLKGEG